MAKQNPNIESFIDRWAGRGDEKQETQKYWIDLLHSVFGFDDPTQLIEFEKRVKLEDSTRFIDAYIPQTKVIIEQKSVGINLSKAGSQSGGETLTPFYQAKRYNDYLPADEKARWIVCCNFERLEIHDMNKPLAEPEVVLLKNLEKDVIKLSFLKDIKVKSIRREEEISFRAGRLVGDLYDMILPQYKDPNNADTLKSLNQLCVRLVFCLYAEDTGLFGQKDKFYNYLKEFNPGQFRKALIELFKVFDTPYEDRDEYMDPELASFPYIKGGIFTEEIEIPLFTQEIIDKLLVKASLEVDWSDISPTIFGAVFESTLNPQTRRSGGMHYTSVENIHKVIDPLFLDELKEDLDKALSIPVKSKRDKSLTEYQDKLASLKFLDPACGSGNFLTETYLSLRRLENTVLENLGMEGMLYLGDDFSPIKVKIDQFYGIEINDFAVSVARTALWIAESQTMKETEHIVGRPIEYFPLRENPNIVEGNALKVNWETVAEKSKLCYIMGNPPFIGNNNMSQEQRNDVSVFFKDNKTVDYVTCWFIKASEMMFGTNIKTAFVSTNSISQGEQVPIVWKPIFENYHVHIDFAWRTFKWDSEASQKAHVHCVIIGFSCFNNNNKRRLFDSVGRLHLVENINAYLLNGPDVFIENRPKPLCEVEPIRKGNQPTDGGNLILSQEDYEEFLSREPGACRYIKKLVGAKEYINNIPRYCLWLVNVSPSELLSMPMVLERISKVRESRLNSPDPSTRKLADTPTVFRETNNPSTFILVPSTTSENRKYVPMGFMSDDTIPTNAVLIIPDAGLYTFGVLTSSIHMAWTRAICGRLKSDYRYSKDIVYNNFPWPIILEDKKETILCTAQEILIARAKYKDCSLADMYGEKMYLFPELVKAHQANDRAVMEAYGFDQSMSEEQIVAELLKMYQKLVEQNA